jgi:hypothetical protein
VLPLSIKRVEQEQTFIYLSASVTAVGNEEAIAAPKTSIDIHHTTLDVENIHSTIDIPVETVVFINSICAGERYMDVGIAISRKTTTREGVCQACFVDKGTMCVGIPESDPQKAELTRYASSKEVTFRSATKVTIRLPVATSVPTYAAKNNAVNPIIISSYLENGLAGAESDECGFFGLENLTNPMAVGINTAAIAHQAP